ncbi:MAG: manganese catalase family protein [Bacilli bacterium]|nr:manganese catalase family protein [Bacilli bacterium]
MWRYEKKLQFPVNIKNKDVRLAKSIVTQFGGPDGELAAALRYLSQRYTMPDERGKALLTDIGTEELAHVEMISAMVYQLIQDATIEELKAAGLDGYYADHGKGIYPINASGVPFSATYFASKGDPIVDLYEDLAAEEKARITYEYLMNLTNDPDVIAPLAFLHHREVVHFDRFKDLLDDYLKRGI